MRVIEKDDASGGRRCEDGGREVAGRLLIDDVAGPSKDCLGDACCSYNCLQE